MLSRSSGLAVYHTAYMVSEVGDRMDNWQQLKDDQTGAGDVSI